MDPFIGEIRMFAGTFAPQGWFLCEGQTLPIAQYQALFAVIGTQFGGNGANNFCLPDLRGRVAVCAGSGTGLTPRTQSDNGGSERVTLDANSMPSHQHAITNTVNTSGLTVGGAGTIKCSNVTGTSNDPTNAYLAKAKEMGDMNYIGDPSKVTGTLASDAVQLNATIAGTATVTSQCQPVGGGIAHENMQPWLAVNFIISFEGIFPSRP